MPNELPEKYLLLGPDHPNTDGVVMCWHNAWGWTLPELGMLYDHRILEGVLLPQGTQAIMDMETGTQYPVDSMGKIGIPVI
jgi:hypothetical protein